MSTLADHLSNLAGSGAEVAASLHGGHTMQGRVVAVRGPSVQLVGPQGEWILVPLLEIVALTVFDGSRWQDQLTGGAHEIGPDTEVPTPLALKRQARDLSEGLSADMASPFRVQLPELQLLDDAARYSLHRALDDLEEAAASLQQTYGTDALQLVSGFVLFHGAPEVDLRDGLVHVGLDLGAGRPGRLPAKDLVTAIATVL